MYLIIGAALPAELRTTLLGLQAHFPDKSWVPESYLFLPFCTLGPLPTPGFWKKLIMPCGTFARVRRFLSQQMDLKSLCARTESRLE